MARHHGPRVPDCAHGSTAQEPGRTADTLDQYRRRGQDLLSSYMREQGLSPGGGESSPVAFARWLADRRRLLRPATWRLYRQAVLYLVEGWPDADRSGVARILGEAPGPVIKPPPRTSARKAKRIPERDYLTLCQHLVRRDTIAGWATRDWLIAGIATGLRPGEWREAALVQHGKRHLLAFTREKTTNGHGLSERAVLDVSALGHTELTAIQHMAECGREWHAARQYASRQEACGQVLRDACRTLWPGRGRGYSLYSCRHQATSHFKADLSPEGVAALLGHAVTDTMVSYGKSRNAWSLDNRSPPPQPLPGAVALVRSTAKTIRRRADRDMEQDTSAATRGPR